MLPRQGKGKEGLDWYASKPATFEEHVKKAVKVGTSRLGVRPNVCYVNPKTKEGDISSVDGVSIRTAGYVLPDHFWVVYEEREMGHQSRLL